MNSNTLWFVAVRDIYVDLLGLPETDDIDTMNRVLKMRGLETKKIQK